MKKDWTETMRDKLSESAVTPPDDLWAGISSELDAVAAPNRQTSKPVAIWRWAAVAASLAAVAICGVYYCNIDKDLNAPAEIFADNSHVGAAADSPQPKDENYTLTIAHQMSINKSATTHKERDTVITDNSADETEIVADSSPSLEMEVISSYGLTPDTTVVVDHTNYKKRPLAQTQEPLPIESATINRGNLSLSLFACNPNVSGLYRGGDMSSYSGGLMSSINPSVTEDDAINGSNTTDSQSDNSYKVKDTRHKQPLRFGVSARVPISGVISIGTGITYSLLSSTITMVNVKSRTYDVDQTLHYIGIPVSVDYNLPSYRSFSFYITGGAMVEKCVYGQSRVSHSPYTDSVKEGGLQLSMFAGAGINLNLNDRIALYAEPLATYYFDNHSAITNIYKDRPLNIDLRIGLRYTFR